MKVLTVQQPFATLIMLGAKHHETRRWVTRHRGPLAIHAGRHYNLAAVALAQAEPFGRILAAADYSHFEQLPLGAILGTVHVEAVEPTRILHAKVSAQERQCGFWTDGNFAWQLQTPWHWRLPLPTPGKPGLWEIDDDVICAHLAPAA